MSGEKQSFQRPILAFQLNITQTNILMCTNESFTIEPGIRIIGNVVGYDYLTIQSKK